MLLIRKNNNPINRIQIFKGGGPAKAGSGFSRTMTHGAQAAERMMSRFESSIAGIQPKFTRANTVATPKFTTTNTREAKAVVISNPLQQKVLVPEQQGFTSNVTGIAPKYISVDTNLPRNYHSTDTGTITHRYISTDTNIPQKYVSTNTKDIAVNQPVLVNIDGTQITKRRGFGRHILLPTGLAFGAIGLGGLLASDSRQDDTVAANPVNQPMVIYRPPQSAPVNKPQEAPTETNTRPTSKKSSGRKKDISQAKRIIYVPVQQQPVQQQLVQNNADITGSQYIVPTFPENVDYDPQIDLSDMLIDDSIPVPDQLQKIAVNF